ncbi:endonuclease domain-containing protein [Brevibacillus massiliensis]|uniref:endonuclease domain-containing protein n=1 Tax=Brevibacillus massiliensis TaxID=1118054 RepID=UPI000557C245|nr:DUF559 domain-containing protein [Brevibacillus massiliensis]
MSWEEVAEERIQSRIELANLEISAAEKFCKSPIEKIAYIGMRDLLFAFGAMNLLIYPQFKIGTYTVDFLIKFKPKHSSNESKELSIVVECDGHDWHEKSKEQVARDKERERFIAKQGYLLLRYSGSEIVDEPHRIVSDITEIIFRWWPRIKSG